MKTCNIITGELLQEIASVYFGHEDDFQYNPFVYKQFSKHKTIQWLNHNLYDNPKVIFCYSHRVHELSKVIDSFMYPFILITHNSDENIVEIETTKKIVECPNVIKWYAQNAIYKHPKIHILPIGIANRQWNHGAQFVYYYYSTVDFYKKTIKKNHIYFNFSIQTNVTARKECYESVIKKIPFLENIGSLDNIIRLETYQFCICPEGNGVDTHRFWEALYLKTVPIVKRTPFIEHLVEQMKDLPIVILESWDDLDIKKIPPYDSFSFSSRYLDFVFYKNEILDMKCLL